MSLGHLLFRAARLLNEVGVARTSRELGVPGLRTAHMQVLPHLDLQGTRATEIARRMGISKQAVGELLDEIEAMGVIERVPDPTDGRARIVRFTESGRAGLLAGLGVLAEVEAELAARVGTETIARLKADLAVVLPAIEAMAEEAPAPGAER
ncbi:MAG: MarR family transcriptional regulator [Pseudomonadota bacterium]|nr:MarR family transcriptional regulator [Pseudomonadota bacterium]